MDVVRLNLFDPDRQEGIKANVQGAIGQLNAFLAQRDQQIPGEMQASSRRSGGAFVPAINRLITFGVGQRSMNIGWQRRLAHLPENRVYGLAELDDTFGFV